MEAPSIEEIAKWPAPNYINPETRGPANIAVLAVGLGVMLIFMTGRIVSRIKLVGGLKLDDWVMIVGAIFATGTSILGILCVTEWGGGHHLWDLKFQWLLPYMKAGLATQILFNFCVTFPKLSLCCTYLYIFPSRANRIFCYFMIAYMCLWLIAVELVLIFECHPISDYWAPIGSPRNCLNLSSFHLINGAQNSLSDFLVYLWPSRSIMTIQLPLRTRLGLLFVFTVGSIVSVAGVLRMWAIHKIFTGYEYFWDGALLWMMASIEWNLGIVLGCFHQIRPMLALFFPAVFGTEVSRKGGSIGYTSQGQSRGGGPPGFGGNYASRPSGDRNQGGLHSSPWERDNRSDSTSGSRSPYGTTMFDDTFSEKGTFEMENSPLPPRGIKQTRTFYHE